MKTLINPKSTHRSEIVPISLEKLENSDNLSIVRVDLYTVVVNTKDWIGKNKGIYLPPDSLVDLTRTEFTFLDKPRIKTRRIRGTQSWGLLIPVPEYLEHLPIGTDVAKELNIKHWQPEENATHFLGKTERIKFSNEICAAPEGLYLPKYDVDDFMAYGKKVFVEDEDCILMEKINGESARYVYWQDKYHCSSHTYWKREFNTLPKKLTLEYLIEQCGKEKGEALYEQKVVNFKSYQNKWWKVLRTSPALMNFLKENPGYCVYGEIYGNNKGMNYGKSPDNMGFVAFDVLTPAGRWMNFHEFYPLLQKYEVPVAPVLSDCYKFNAEELIKLASGKTLLNNAKHIREGLCVRPLIERWDERLGRVHLKIRSPEYFAKDFRHFEE